MLWTDKLACLEIPPVIRDVNVLPSVIPSPSPVILSGVKNLTQLRVDLAKNPQGLKSMQRQSLLPARFGVTCNVALRRILTYTDDSSEEEYGCVSILISGQGSDNHINLLWSTALPLPDNTTLGTAFTAPA